MLPLTTVGTTMTSPSDQPVETHTIHVGDTVRCILGTARVLKIDLYDGGHASGVYLEVVDENGGTVGMIGGSIEGLGVQPIEGDS